ncbi:CDP-glycerol glycerophosphotransferase family protein [Scopulibacillus cellulosilyticus]|uniref:CDP-glycerol glycerophosphotransferase family protein n=1 Tax=Scopulibacillus cellulosilyticus TaxID=2665665 RepID=A0ABW2PUY8_9BACL
MNAVEASDQIYLFLEDNLQIKEGYSDFSGKRSLHNKKNNKKYYLYSNHGETVVKTVKYKPMEIIEVVPSGNEQIIFYSDSNCNISFVKSKIHSVLTPDQIADKVEKHPMLRSFVFMLFSSLIIFGILRFREYNFININLSLGYKKTCNYKVNFLFPKKIRNKFSMKTNKLSLLVHAYWVRIPLRDIYEHYLNTSDINVPIFVKVLNNGINYYYNFKERTKDKYSKKHFIFNTRSIRVFKSDVEMYVRKSITGQYVIVVSSIMSKVIVLKEKLAYFLTLFKPKREIYDIYFEKFAQGASESGFELFKYAIKSNRNSIYILDKDNENFYQLKRKYPKNLFAKNSVSAFYYIFLARSFISSDLVSHLQRRLYDNDKLFKKKILSINKKVFLQHGPSLATNIFERGYFNRKVPIAPDYIIVNSKFERDLFINNTSYNSRQLLMTGIPNMDLYANERDSKKEEITFMLTWRPWDLTGKIEEGSYLGRYFQFFNMIENEEFYKDKKITIILHPKSKIILQEQFPDIYNEKKHLFYEGDIKDKLLESKILITDYSSVCYYGFCGGANIIFYWEDKELGEREYGAPNILQENIAFGDIVNKFKDLNKAIQKNFYSNQLDKYKEKFNNLIEFHEGGNTRNTYNYLNELVLNKRGK